MGSVNELLKSVPIPRMALIEQKFDEAHIEDVPGTVFQELIRMPIGDAIVPEMRVAITAGSRGVDNIDIILREIVRYLKEKGAYPFIIPAMGSHGGATAEGQKEILRAYGITEETMGCPIKATMEVRQIGTTGDGRPVMIDRYAAEADGIVVVNRIKPHTAFRGTFESGLMKMMAIGLGKQAGAQVVHQEGIMKIGPNVELFSRAILENTNILFGVGLVENAYDRTALIRAIPGSQIPIEEPGLLEIAGQKMASIFTDHVDVLVVDQIGKDISGEGMDPNIAGRWIVPNIQGGIDACRLAVLDLTEHTLGNSVGLGMADVCSRRAAEKVDRDSTYPNSLTSKVPRLCAIPMQFDNHKLTIQAAIKMVPEKRPEEITMIRIRDTLSLDTVWVSENLLPLIDSHENLTLLEGPKEMAFDAAGDLF